MAEAEDTEFPLTSSWVCGASTSALSLRRLSEVNYISRDRSLSWTMLGTSSLLCAGGFGLYTYSVMEGVAGKWQTAALVTGMTGLCLCTEAITNLLWDNQPPRKRFSDRKELSEEMIKSIAVALKRYEKQNAATTSNVGVTVSTSGEAGELIPVPASPEAIKQIKRPFSPCQYSVSECLLFKEIDRILMDYQKIVDVGRGFPEVRTSETSLFEQLVQILSKYKYQIDVSPMGRTKRRLLSVSPIQRSPRRELPSLSEAFNSRLEDIVESFTARIAERTGAILKAFDQAESRMIAMESRLNREMFVQDLEPAGDNDLKDRLAEVLKNFGKPGGIAGSQLDITESGQASAFAANSPPEAFKPRAIGFGIDPSPSGGRMSNVELAEESLAVFPDENAGETELAEKECGVDQKSEEISKTLSPKTGDLQEGASLSEPRLPAPEGFSD